MDTENIFDIAKSVSPKLAFDGEYESIPEQTQYSLLQWVLFGRPGGDFLTAVLTNDLASAFGHADDENAQALSTIVRWLYYRAPSTCWNAGSFQERRTRMDELSRNWVGLKTTAILEEDDGDPA